MMELFTLDCYHTKSTVKTLEYCVICETKLYEFIVPASF